MPRKPSIYGLLRRIQHPKTFHEKGRGRTTPRALTMQVPIRKGSLMTVMIVTLAIRGTGVTGSFPGQKKLLKGSEPVGGSSPKIDWNMLHQIQQSNQVGARLMNFSEKWSKLTSDRWVLNIVQEGLKLIFKCRPPITGTRITNFPNCVLRQCILDEVDDLLKSRQ